MLEEEDQAVSHLTLLKSKYLNQHQNKNFKGQEVLEEENQAISPLTRLESIYLNQHQNNNS